MRTANLSFSVLSSLTRNARRPQVKRVVILASCASVLTSTTEPATYDESSWNEPAIAEAAGKGDKTPLMVAYRASKTLAEKAAWKFIEENKSEIGWDLVVINPPFVWGVRLPFSPRSLTLLTKVRW